MTIPDLNLLHVFDLLFEERSVSGVARRMNLTQSAISHALARLRDMIGDPLFTRGAGGLRPTARAEELAPQLREILARVRVALNPPEFTPATSTRSFTIAGGSYFCRLVGPRLIALARDVAPGVALRLVNIDQALLDGLDHGTIDIAIGAFERVPARIRSEPLLRDTAVWVASLRHPLAGTTPDLATLTSQPRLWIVTDYALRPLRMGDDGEQLRRRLIIGDSPASAATRGRSNGAPRTRVYDVDTAAAVIGRTDLLAVLPRRLAATRAAEEGLYLFDTPTSEPDIMLTMLWHGRIGEDAGLAWLRRLIVEASAPASEITPA